MNIQPRGAMPALVTIAISLLLTACGGGDGASADTSGGSASGGSTSSGTTTYQVSGVLSGLLPGNKLTLLDNGGDTLAVSANGAFTFAAPIAFNTTYAVTVGTQPLWQWCSVANGSGTATTDVSNVAVTCAAARAQVSTFAGSTIAGAADGAGTAASFSTPDGVAQDSAGNLYVADWNNRLIRKITPSGVVSTFAGSGTSGNANGVGTAASFASPAALTVDQNDNIYVADYGNAAIRKITPDGTVSTLVAGIPGMFGPMGVATDASGTVYVSDFTNSRILKVTGGSTSLLAGSASQGNADGTGSAASFNAPRGLAVDSSGNVYVADAGNNEIRKITPGGVVSTFAGSGAGGWADGIGTAALFNIPTAIAFDGSGALYVADFANDVIRKISPAGVVSTLAGSGSAGAADGIGATAVFKLPFGLCVDAGGNVFVADSGNNEIRKITPIQ